MHTRTDNNPPRIRAAKPFVLPLLMGSMILTGSVTMLALSSPSPQMPQHAVITGVGWTEPVAEPEPEDAEPKDNETDVQEEEGIRECVITLQSGRTITGELVFESSREVIIGINGIETTFQRRNVANVVVLPPVSERFEQLRATVSDDDVESRLALVEWLRARRAYQLAIKELKSILIVDPQNPHAKLLHTWLNEYDKLTQNAGEEKADENQASEEPADETDEPERIYNIERNSLPHLSDEQINLLRVYEIDLRDPPKLRVPDETMLKLMREYPNKFSPDEAQRQKLLLLPEVEKLKLLFTHRARHLYSEVQVLENPRSLQLFKDQVHTGRGWLMNACASTRCHGGVDAGSFRLINTKPNTNETSFTNLYIIEKSTLANGTPLIDFEYPERSALLQMGMIQSKALIPHPELPRDYPGLGFRPIFRDTQDRKYQQAVEWIRAMYQPRPKLDFDYPLPQSKPTPKPDLPKP